jgi:hypothetical protein
MVRCLFVVLYLCLSAQLFSCAEEENQVLFTEVNK